MAFPDAQGTTVSFDGSRLGGFIRFDTTPASCSESDVTNLDSRVVGSGIASRVVREFHPGTVDPGGATVEVYGAPAFGALRTGDTGSLVISGGWGSVNYEAFLAKFTVSGSVGELVRTTLEFKFT